MMLQPRRYASLFPSGHTLNVAKDWPFASLENAEAAPHGSRIQISL